MANIGSGKFRTLNVTNDNKQSLTFNQAGTYKCTVADHTMIATGAVSIDADAASHFKTSSGNIDFDAEAGAINIDGGGSSATAIYLNATNTAGGIKLKSGTNGILVNTTGDITFTSNGNDINLGVPDDNIGALNALNLTKNIQIEGTETVSINSADFQVVTSDSINLISGGNFNFGSSLSSPALKFIGNSVLINSPSTSASRALEVGVQSNSAGKTGYDGILINSSNSTVSPNITFSNNDALGVLDIGVESELGNTSIQDTYIAYQSGTNVYRISGPEFTTADIGKRIYWSSNETSNTITAIGKSITSGSLISNKTLADAETHTLTTGGTYTGTTTVYYKVEIDSIDATPDTFKWSNDAGKTFSETYKPIVAASAFTLENGVQITFSHATGYSVGDYWTFSALVTATVSTSATISTRQEMYTLKPNISYLFNSTTTDLKIGTSNHERLRLTAEGNLGIGNTNPLDTFQVSSKVGERQLVNTYVTGKQINPAIANLVNGGYVIVWESQSQDGSDYGIYGQIFNADGTRNGNEFKVNTTTSGQQSFPDVAGNLDTDKGGFMVVWSSEESNGSGTYDIKAQIYDETKADGSRNVLNGEINSVNTTTNYTQKYPKVTSLTNGNYVVVWESDNNNDGNHNIYGQIITSIGNFSGAETAVNSVTTYSQNYPVVAPISADDSTYPGGFVVAFMSEYHDSNSFYDVKYRIFNSSFVAQNVADVSVNSNSGVPLTSGLVDIVGLNTGGFVISLYENYEGKATSFTGDTQINGLTSNTTSTVASLSGSTVTLTHVNGLFIEGEEIQGQTFNKKEKIGAVTQNGSGGTASDTATITLSTGYKKVTAYKYNCSSDSAAYQITSVNSTTLVEDAERAAISTTNFTRDNTVFTYKRPMAHISNLNDDNYVITWTNDAVPSVYYRKFQTSDGSALTDEIKIDSTYSEVKQRNQVVCNLKTKSKSDAGFCIAWESEGQDLSTIPDSGIFNMRFDDDNFLFRANNGFSSTVITHSGNVGVGTTSPSTLMQLEGTSPYITLKNTNTSVGPGLGAGKIIFEDSNGNTLGEIKGCYSSDLEDRNPQQTYLTGWYKLNETSGNSTTDSSTNSNTGTLYNFDLTKCWVQGKINNGLDFDGVDSYVSLGNGTTISNIGGNSFTITAWVKLVTNVTTSASYDIISNNGGTTQGTYIFTLIDSGDNDTVLARGTIYTSGGAQTVTGSTKLNDSAWHHIAFVLNTSGTGLVIYVDGAKDNTGTVTYSGTLAALTANVYLGERSAGTTNNFRGTMDDVRIYNTALTSTEITTLYNNVNQVRGKLVMGINDGSGTISDINSFTIDNKGLIENFGVRGSAPTSVSGSLTSSGTSVSGSSTSFTSELKVGDQIEINSSTTTVTQITSDTALTVADSLSSATDTSVERLPYIFGVLDSSNNIKMVVHNSGIVGIGEPSPTSLLHISGTGDSSTDSPYITLRNTTSEDTNNGRESQLIFEGLYSSNYIKLGQIETCHDGSSSDSLGKIRFYTNRGNTNSTLEERMVISSGGNVGIGVNVTTKGLLHIKSGGGSTENCDMVMTSNVSAEEIVMGGKSNIYFQGTTPGALGALETYSYGKIMGSSDASADDRNGRLDFFTNNTTTNKLIPRMTIKNSGNVGVGINEPQSVFQASPFFPNNVYNSSTTAGQSGNTVTSTGGFTADMVGGVIVFANNKNGAKTITGYTSATVVTVGGDAETISTGTSYQVFYPGLNVDSTGEVGVGTMSPDRRLEVLDSSNPQLRLTHTDASKYCDFEVDTNHDLTVTPSSAGVVKFPAPISIGSSRHIIVVDQDIRYADSGNDTVIVEVPNYKIPAGAIITMVSATVKTLSNLTTHAVNLYISQTSGTAADSSVTGTPVEILGAGVTNTDSTGSASASDIVLSSGGGTLKNVWLCRDTVRVAAADHYIYVCNAGTSNGTTNSTAGTLSIMIEYIGMD